MLHAMPLIWCGVLFILFAAYLAAEVWRPAAILSALLALALSIAGARPWIQTAIMGACWLLLRLILYLLSEQNKNQSDDNVSSDWW